MAPQPAPPDWNEDLNQHAPADALAAALADSQAALNIGTKRILELESRCEELSRHLEAERTANVSLRTTIEQHHLQQAAAENLLTLKDREIVDAQSHLLRATENHKASVKYLIASGIEFDSAFQHLRKQLAGQRAWRVMLAIRKAYTLWTSHGLNGKLRALNIPFELKSPALFQYDVGFPSLWDYWPATGATPRPLLHQPAARGNPARHDVIVLPIFDFEFRYQRPQQLAAHLANAGHRVFWLSPTRFHAPTSASQFRAFSRPREIDSPRNSSGIATFSPAVKSGSN